MFWLEDYCLFIDGFLKAVPDYKGFHANNKLYQEKTLQSQTKGNNLSYRLFSFPHVAFNNV